MQLKAFLQTLTLIHAALCASLVLFGFFVYAQNGDFTAGMSEQDIFIYIVPIVALAGYFLSQVVIKKRMASISKEEKLATKLGKYQIASIIVYALLEVPGILAITAFFLSGNALYLVIAIALVAYLIAQRPTADKIRKELPLTYEEQKQFFA